MVIHGHLICDPAVHLAYIKGVFLPNIIAKTPWSSNVTAILTPVYSSTCTVGEKESLTPVPLRSLIAICVQPCANPVHARWSFPGIEQLARAEFSHHGTCMGVKNFKDYRCTYTTIYVYSCKKMFKKSSMSMYTEVRVWVFLLKLIFAYMYWSRTGSCLHFPLETPWLYSSDQTEW